MSSTRPLDLPEVRAHLALVLSRKSLLNCLRVSRAWHASFYPIVWRTLKLETLPPQDVENPYLALVRKNIHHVHHLTLRVKEASGDLMMTTPLDFTFPNLKRLQLELPVLACECEQLLEYNDGNADHGTQEERPELEDALSAFLRRHQHGRIAHLYFDFGDVHPHSPKYWPEITRYRNLKSLTLHNGLIHSRDWGNCWRMWSKVENTLRLDGMVNSNYFKDLMSVPFIDPSQFGEPTRIQTLQLHVFGVDFKSMIPWLKHSFPDLRSLTWREGSTEEVQLLAQAIRDDRGFCSQMSGLIMDSEVASSNAILELVLAIKRLEVLSLQFRAFEDACWQSVMQQRPDHLLTLREVSLRIEGPMVQQLLCSMPNLEKFGAKRLSGLEMLADSRPWVCPRLKELRLQLYLELERPRGGIFPIGTHFEDFFRQSQMDSLLPPPLYRGDSSDNDQMRESLKEQHDHILDQLAQQTHLERLVLQSWTYYTQRPHVRDLDLRLTCGLDRLRTLKRLSVITFRGTDQFLAEEEVEWMLKHWPRLEKKSGKNHPSSVRHRQLDEIFRRAEVEVEDQ
ncbi:hypothetical protein BGZ83_000888 [Gryganskiella cystojenkinii]|nr:hypothetical protein BGZ83_000888 [Gryganskiella cystojenkinii]